MNVVIVVYAMIAGVGFTLALVHLPVWLLNREARTSLAFTVAALCTGAIACAELVMLTATTPAGFALAQRWSNLPLALLFIALAAFGHQYLGGGRIWLALAGIGMRIVALALNFGADDNINFREVTSLGSVDFLGARVAVAIGVRNPWSAILQLDAFLLMLFFADASAAAWRQGRRSVALLVGGSLTFFMLASALRSLLVVWLGLEIPSMASLFSLGVVLVMGYAMSADLLRARELAHALAERELQANLTAEAGHMGTWVRDMATGAIQMSAKGRDLLGFSADEKVTFDSLLRRIRADDRVGFEERLARAARECGPYHVEFRLALPDGQIRWIAAMGRVVCDARGRPARSRGACIDITTRKMQERETLRLRHDIAHVGRVSVMGQLASALAHEINQPLGAILRNAEAASLFVQEPSPDLAEIAAIVEDIRKDALRASAVIDRVRGLLRRQKMTTEMLDTGQMLGDVARLLRPDALARHITLLFDAPPGLPSVQGDRVQLQQVLLNLIQNGMDAIGTEDGRARTVAVTARRSARETLEISVADSGSGIPAGEEHQIFGPFFTTKKAGIGLGLSISRSIVEAHGGHLHCENNPGGGATFRFTLPVARG
jgi:two-component system sensor kinase FixL